MTLLTGATWDAVLKRDRYADGTFVYAAMTTGIYCRPSCPARLPHQRNTLIFKTAAEAERQRFIPCRRCHPGAGALTPMEKAIKDALKYIESHLTETVSLRTLSQACGLSPNHLQQKFQSIVGLSPKAFCDARRLAHFKLHLRRGESVTSACYAVGFGSSRALYEKTRRGLGMIPVIYRQGGQGLTIRYATSEIPLGNVLLAATESGLCSVRLGREEKGLIRALRAEFPKAALVRYKEPPREWISALRRCQCGDPLLSTLPRTLQNYIFQAKVWRTLA
jgi:AraC family transcriptional regulator, regulatory protein of adaptative response / methylated-DNA-[protein]-cysteine methyltransferase